MRGRARLAGRARRLAALALVVAIAGCAGRAPSPPAVTTSPADVRRVLVAWLECEECSDGELEAVVRLGDAAVPSLIASLRDGPSAASREQQRRHLLATYEKLKTFAAARGRTPASSEADYVRTYTDNYVALYRSRSAIALGAIGGPRAATALDAAARASYRDDVATTVAAARKRLAP